MTKAQQRTIEAFRAVLHESLGKYKEEIKHFETTDSSLEDPILRSVTIRVTIGNVGDEDYNCIVRVLTRRRGIFFIGPRGGVTYYGLTKSGDICKTRRRCLLKSYAIHRALIEQHHV